MCLVLIGAGCSDLTTTTATQTAATAVVIPTTTVDISANRPTVATNDAAIVSGVISDIGSMLQLTLSDQEQTCLTAELTSGINPTTMAALRADPTFFDLAAPDRAPVLAMFDPCIPVSDYVAQLSSKLVAAGASNSSATCLYTRLHTLGFTKLVEYANGLTSDEGPDPAVAASVAKFFKDCGVRTEATAPPSAVTDPPVDTSPSASDAPDPSAGPLDTTTG